MPDRPTRTATPAPPTTAALDRLLAAAVWRRVRWPLVAVAAVVASGLAAVAADLPLFVAVTWQDDPVHDTTLQLTLSIAAFCLAAALHRGDPSLRRWLRRLPIDPVRLLVVRLGFAIVAALVILVAVVAVEWLATPTLFEPSFAERLNPIEADTLARLPGVPLVRWQIDGVPRDGLVSALTLAKLQTYRLNTFGSLGRWQPREEALPPVEPGDRVLHWTAADWSTLHRWWADRLRAGNVSTGSTIEATLIRYVPEAEYRDGPWRRDGLLRAPGSPMLRRAVGFLGLVVLLVAASHLASRPSTRRGHRIGVVTMVTLAAIHQFGGRWLRWLQATDISDGITGWWTTLPTFSAQVGPAEWLRWPGAVLALVLPLILFTGHEMRRGAYGTEAPSSKRWGGPIRLPEIPIVGAILLIFLGFGFHGFRLDGYQSTLAAITPRLIAYSGLGATAAILVIRWSRNDALLSRMPVDPRRHAMRRLAIFGAWCVLFAVILPAALGELPGLRPTALLSPAGGDGFTREDAFYLHRHGAVPVLTPTSESSARAEELAIPAAVPRCFLYRDDVYRNVDSSLWEAPMDGFLPRGLSFLHGSNPFVRGDIEIAVGATLDVGLCRLRVTRLLTSRSEVESFLATADADAIGPVPRRQGWGSAVEIVVCGALVLAVATFCRSRRVIWALTPATIWIFMVANRWAWFKLIGFGNGIPPWWGTAAGTGIVTLLLFLAFVRLRRRIEQGFILGYRDSMPETA